MEISSRNVVEGTARAPHRAMYKAMGLTDEDLSKQFTHLFVNFDIFINWNIFENFIFTQGIKWHNNYLLILNIKLIFQDPLTD